ncbi:MAG: hypothetical protein AABY26_02615 [Nanoarchaeota archaeon]
MGKTLTALFTVLASCSAVTTSGLHQQYYEETGADTVVIAKDYLQRAEYLLHERQNPLLALEDLETALSKIPEPELKVRITLLQAECHYFLAENSYLFGLGKSETERGFEMQNNCHLAVEYLHSIPNKYLTEETQELYLMTGTLCSKLDQPKITFPNSAPASPATLLPNQNPLVQ